MDTAGWCRKWRLFTTPSTSARRISNAKRNSSAEWETSAGWGVFTERDAPANVRSCERLAWYPWHARSLGVTLCPTCCSRRRGLAAGQPTSGFAPPTAMGWWSHLCGRCGRSEHLPTECPSANSPLLRVGGVTSTSKIAMSAATVNPTSRSQLGVHGIAGPRAGAGPAVCLPHSTSIHFQSCFSQGMTAAPAGQFGVGGDSSSSSRSVPERSVAAAVAAAEVCPREDSRSSSAQQSRSPLTVCELSSSSGACWEREGMTSPKRAARRLAVLRGCRRQPKNQHELGPDHPQRQKGQQAVACKRTVQRLTLRDLRQVKFNCSMHFLYIVSNCFIVYSEHQHYCSCFTAQQCRPIGME